MSAINFADHESHRVLKAASMLSSRGQIVIPIEIRKETYQKMSEKE